MNKSYRTRQQLLDELQGLSSQQTEAEETLRAILSGEVDGLVVSSPEGEKVFTLSGADFPYRVMVETMNEGAVTLSSDGTILYCNHCFTAIVQDTWEKVLGSSILHYISSADLPSFEALLAQALKGSGKSELTLQTRSEKKVPVILSLSALQHPDIPGTMCMVITDLTEQKRREELLAEERLTSEILQQAAEIFVLCDGQGLITRASRSTNQLFGKSPIHQKFDEAFHLFNHDGTPFFLLSAIGDERHPANEVVFRHGDKEPLSFLLSANALTTDQGVLGIVVVMVDITFRKETERKIEHLASFPELNPNPVIETDLKGQVIYSNPATKLILKKLNVAEDARLFLPRDLNEIIQELEQEDDQQLLVREIELNGSVFIENIFLSAKLKVMRIYAQDITERKKLEARLQESHDALESQVSERTLELQSALSEIKIIKDQLEAENIYFRSESKIKYQFKNILGQSDGLKYVLYRAEQVAPINTTVLILGETGTGKELIAFAIHDMSPRKERSMITVNCAALPGNLIESELFGREKGAFTGADKLQIGRFEIANGSTICLDEIGELPLEMQAKLLRVLQHGEFERLGSSHTIKVDVRIIATTNRDLEEEVRQGRFRQDLYYRLNVFPITVPPLRQRKEDIPLMVPAFAKRYSKKVGKPITSIGKEAMKALHDYAWPGNIRELESIIERAVILCPGPVLQLADKLDNSSPSNSSAARTMEETERNHIQKILFETGWHIEGKDGAAAILGLHPSTLRARMHKLGIVRQATKKTSP